MLNKSLNIQKEIKNDNGSVVGFLSSQISIGYGTINFSIQIIDRDYAENNPAVIKTEYLSFIEEVNIEATKNGWSALI